MHLGQGFPGKFILLLLPLPFSYLGKPGRLGLLCVDHSPALDRDEHIGGRCSSLSVFVSFQVIFDEYRLLVSMVVFRRFAGT